MNVRKLVLLVGAVAALGAVTALPGGAAVTPTSFTLTGGGLSISAPTSNVSLGTQVASTSPTTISGHLGTVTVTDQRGGATTWVASVIVTAFTPTPAATAIAAVNVHYVAGTVTESGVTTVLPGTTDLTGVSPVVNGTSTGISSASWNPMISVDVPANAPPGVYSATITHSVA